MLFLEPRLGGPGRSSRASEHPPTKAVRQQAGERAAGQHQRTRDNGEALHSLRRRERWIDRRSGNVRRHAAEVEEEPGCSVAQHENRQDCEGQGRGIALGASAKVLCRHPACQGRRNPEADKDNEARESIRDQEG